MADARRRGRMVLVIGDDAWPEPPWLAQLQELFVVATISTLAGASLAIEGQEVAAVILVLSDFSASGEGREASPGLSPRAWVAALRRHPSLERTSVFILARQRALVAADVVGFTDVDVIEREVADFELSLRVGAVATRMSARPVARRQSEATYANDTRRLESLAPKPGPEAALLPSIRPAALSEPLGVTSDPKLLQRFARECTERGERGLALCERLSQRSAPAGDRERAADELGGLLAAAKGEAALLALRDLALLFGMAELAVSRLNVGRGQVLVPRGVVGLLSDLVDLGRAEQLGRLDVELHRGRLASAIDR